MRFMLSTLVAVLALGTSSAIRKLESNDLCTATLVATQGVKEGKAAMELGLTCVLKGETIYEVEIDDSFIEDNFVNGPYKSTHAEFNIPTSATIDNNAGIITVPNKSAIVLRKKKGGRTTRKAGARTVLVVRIELINDETTATEDELSNAVLGTDGDLVNLKSQTNLCSHGQITYDATPNKSSIDNRPDIRNGATSASVNLRTNDGDAEVRRAVNDELAIQFGVDDASELADHVLYCMPPSTMSGSAYGYVNGWLTVYNNNNCLWPSMQMHEVGHNLGLSHSGEGTNEYGNASCMMGFSYGENEGPKMCYGAPKAWELDWYSTKKITISPDNSVYTGELAGYIEDPDDGSVPPMLVKIDIVGSLVDYYIYFNRAAGFMSGTKEGANKVMISEWNSDGYNDSYLQAKMEAGDSWDIPGYPTGQVVVDSISDRASVRIFLNANPTSSPTPLPPCLGPVLTINVLTDKWEDETQWTLTDVTTGTSLLESTSDLDPYTLYEQSACGTAGSCYNFIITDTFGDGICCDDGDGYYEFIFDGNLIASGGDFFDEATEEYCDDDGSPTSSPVDNDTSTPTLGPATGCPSSESFVQVFLTTDNRPRQTSWSLYDTDTNDIILEDTYTEANRNEDFTYEACVDRSLCLKFTITDNGSDGICCVNGEGQYTVKYDGIVVTTGGDFGDEFSSELFGCSLVTGTPTTAPLTPSPPVPCFDAGFPLAYTEITGGASIPCPFIEEYISDCVCNDPDVRSHCKSTCDSCAEYACVDSAASWLTPTGGAANCAILTTVLSPEDIIFYCNVVDDIRTTCPATCGVCD